MPRRLDVALQAQDRGVVRVAILDDYAGHVPELLDRGALAAHEVVVYADHVEGERLIARLADFDAVVLLQQRTALSAEVVRGLPRLRFVSQTGRHLGHIDLAACRERGVTVSAGGAGRPEAVAELTWALILAASRQLVGEARALAEGRWQSTVGTGLAGKRLAVWALGRIGARVARVGRAFGMRVLAHGREGTARVAREEGYELVEDRARLFAEADVLTLHLPLTEATRGVVGPEDLARMRPDALFVNTSRAGLVGDARLAAAVLAGRPGRAAVDVFEEEPVVAAHSPLVGLERVLATPHLGYAERATLDGLYAAAFRQLEAYAAAAPIDVVVP